MELRRDVLLGAVICVTAAACGDSPAGRTYFERNIAPILEQKCAGNTSGCHAVNEGDPHAFAAGNLDVTTFENIQKRRDTLTPFGAYPHSLFLIKAVGAGKLKMQYGDTFRTIDVEHSGGGILDVGSDAYFTLQTWLENGATENGLRPPTPARAGDSTCSPDVPADFNAAAFTSSPHFASFKATVQPILESHDCNAGNCHGAPQSDFYITCGTDETQLAFNFSQAWAFVNEPADDSQLLRVPLAVLAGGRGHTGGDQFYSATEDAEYVALKDWAAQVGKLPFAEGDPVKQFFADHVQPLLLTRGCSFQACHSPQAGNDFKLRSGAIGFFSPAALQKNYDLLKHEFMALELADARRGRAVSKSVLFEDPRVVGQVGGIPHRGGPVLETPNTNPADPATCPSPFDPATSNAFCTIQEWVRLERVQLGAEVTPMGPGDPIRIVYVDRNPGTATAGRLEFDTFAGGADLRVVTTQFGPNSVVEQADAGASTSLLGGCTGLTAGTADVQAPDVAHDATRIVFAARNSAAEPLGVWMVNIDGTNCQRVTPAAPDANGLKVHNFDPAWAPDGSAVVFASTRGKPGAGPTRSRKRMLPQADIWRVRVSGTTVDQNSYEQVTVLSNSEIGPQFMREGRITMTTEKVSSDGFYQLAGRRINWDLTDYHPLLAQRKTSAFSNPADPASTAPSVGYASATDIHEASNGDFLLILADTNTDGSPALPGAAGALAIFNRSIGPFEQDRRDDGYFASVRLIDAAAATGRAGATAGYRGPVSMPDGTIMAAYASSVGQGNFDIVSVNPRDGTRRALFAGGGRVRVDAQLAYRYPARELYYNRRQLVFGGAADLGDDARAVVHMPDAPMLFTLLTSNLRRGRPLDVFREARTLVVRTEGLCPPGACSPNANGVFESRMELGRAALRDDGSVKIRVPSRTGVVFELVDGAGNVVVQMNEEHQMGPSERISMGVKQELFDAVCGGCHGSITGRELDVIVTPDALTGASQSASAGEDPTPIGP